MTGVRHTRYPVVEHRMPLGLPALVWRFQRPWLAVSSAVHGGGLGTRRWVLNATVPSGYDNPEPARRVLRLADEIGLSGAGTGLLTAVDVRHQVTTDDAGVRASVTTGVGYPIWAAISEEDAEVPDGPGTINAVCFAPVRLDEGALVNAVATVAEAKAQALRQAGVPGTGTCTDATVLMCPADGTPEPYGGPRSTIGAALARATHRAVTEGLESDDVRFGPDADTGAPREGAAG